MNPVYIVGSGEYLPNEAVENDAMPKYLGMVSPALERVRQAVLHQNGIKRRYYALDSNGNPTHTTTEMACKAMLAACQSAERSLDSVDFISAGSTNGDALLPSFASMVHGWLGTHHGMRSIHVHPVEGICCNATHTLEAANIFLAAGKYKNALIATGERSSVGLRAARYEKEYPARNENVKDSNGYQYLDAEFLRYMLSDGGGSLFLSTDLRPNEYALKIDWIETISYANILPTCMYLGACDPDNYDPTDSWVAQSHDKLATKGMMVLRQKTDALKTHVNRKALDFFQLLIDRGQLDVSKISVLAAHISSNLLKDQFIEIMNEPGRPKLPKEKLYTNLESKGNMGCATPLILMHEVFSKRLLQPGETGILLCPESGRFTYSICQFTAVT